jgi:hypothetical protein
MAKRSKMSKQAMAAVIVYVVVGGGALAYALSRKAPKSAGFRGLGAFPSRQGSYYEGAPKALQDLPFNALRDNNPIESGATIQAIEQFVAGQPEVIASVPQNMGFNRWRQGGGVFGGNIEALVTATTARDPFLNELVGVETDRLPRMSLRDTAQAMNALPVESSYYENPVSRGVPQASVIPSPQFWAYANSGGQTPLEPMSPFEQGLEYETVWDGARMMQIERRG